LENAREFFANVTFFERRGHAVHVCFRGRIGPPPWQGQKVRHCLILRRLSAAFRRRRWHDSCNGGRNFGFRGGFRGFRGGFRGFRGVGSAGGAVAVAALDRLAVRCRDELGGGALVDTSTGSALRYSHRQRVDGGTAGVDAEPIGERDRTRLAALDRLGGALAAAGR